MKAVFNEINSLEKLDEIFGQSNDKPVALFKHSTTCPISSQVYQEIKNVDGEINLVIVQTARGVSNAIAERTGIRHESPQAIVIKDGKPIYHASHFDVTAEDVNQKIRISNFELRDGASS